MPITKKLGSRCKRLLNVAYRIIMHAMYWSFHTSREICVSLHMHRIYSRNTMCPIYTEQVIIQCRLQTPQHHSTMEQLTRYIITTYYIFLYMYRFLGSAVGVHLEESKETYSIIFVFIVLQMKFNGFGCLYKSNCDLSMKYVDIITIQSEKTIW